MERYQAVSLLIFTEIVQACDSCCMPRFSGSILLAFISRVKLFDYMVHRGEGWRGFNENLAGWRNPNGKEGAWPQDGEGIKPSGRHELLVF